MHIFSNSTESKLEMGENFSLRGIFTKATLSVPVVYSINTLVDQTAILVKKGVEIIGCLVKKGVEIIG